jgi:hypothetical protein
MNIDLFAGVAVSDLPRAVRWFDRFLGDVESFEPNDVERVWTLAGHRHVYVELQPEHAGHAKITLFVDDFDGSSARWPGAASTRRRGRPTTTAYARRCTATRTATRSVSAVRPTPADQPTMTR